MFLKFIRYGDNASTEKNYVILNLVHGGSVLKTLCFWPSLKKNNFGWSKSQLRHIIKYFFTRNYEKYNHIIKSRLTEEDLFYLEGQMKILNYIVSYIDTTRVNINRKN